MTRHRQGTYQSDCHCQDCCNTRHAIMIGGNSSIALQTSTKPTQADKPLFTAKHYRALAAFIQSETFQCLDNLDRADWTRTLPLLFMGDNPRFSHELWEAAFRDGMNP